MDKKLEFKPMKMVGWFDMKQLSSTAIKASISSIFGSYADKRETIASISEFKIYDYSQRKELWIDYIADVGDGFNSTYTMASLLAQPKLSLTKKDKYDLQLPQGDLLLFGGDQVYPVANREDYINRFKIPYEIAWGKNEKVAEKDMFAVPGNHDWYDGLTNFMKIFCQGRRIGNWRTTQNRSYFAVKLNASTWLFGIDVQLDADIDMPQLEYFETVTTKHMKEGDHVILCSAKPSWVFESTRKDDRSYDTLQYFECRFIRDKKMNLLLSLSGDLHHYSHYEKADAVFGNIHKITAGGGGAFMQGTHHLPEELKNLREGDFKLKKVFPDKLVSRGLVVNNLKFFFKNWSFGLFMGAVYLLFAWFLQTGSRVAGGNILANFELTGIAGFEVIRKQITTAILNSPAVLVMMALIIIGLWKFCEKSAEKKSVGILGVFHGLLHVLLIITLFWTFTHFNYTHLKLSLTTRIPLLVMEMLLFGGFFSSCLMGIYLMTSNLLFRIHDKEAFSAMKIENFKNFLRLHVTENSITVYPVGVEKVAHWEQKAPMKFETAAKLSPELIEDPIVISLNRTPQGN